MKFFGSGLFDWLVFAIAFIFTLVGFAIFLTTGDITLVATSVFFGACSVAAGQSLWQNFRSSRLAGELTVDVIGGVPIVSQQSKQQTIYGVVLLLMGAIMVLTGTSLGWVFVGLSVFIGITGALLLIARVAGWLPTPSLEFHPDGLRFNSGKFTVRLAWDNLQSAVLSDIARNPVVLIRVRDMNPALAGMAASSLKAVIKEVINNQRYFNCEFVLFPKHYNIEAPVFCGALQRYMSDPVARAALGTSRLQAE